MAAPYNQIVIRRDAQLAALLHWLAELNPLHSIGVAADGTDGQE
jgi:hypothetical protein